MAREVPQGVTREGYSLSERDPSCWQQPWIESVMRTGVDRVMSKEQKEAPLVYTSSQAAKLGVACSAQLTINSSHSPTDFMPEWGSFKPLNHEMFQEWCHHTKDSSFKTLPLEGGGEQLITQKIYGS